MTANYISISDIISFILVCQRNNRNKKYRKPVFAENTGFFAHLHHSFSAKKRLNVLLYKKSYHKSRAVCYNIKKFIGRQK